MNEQEKQPLVVGPFSSQLGNSQPQNGAKEEPEQAAEASTNTAPPVTSSFSFQQSPDFFQPMFEHSTDESSKSAANEAEASAENPEVMQTSFAFSNDTLVEPPNAKEQPIKEQSAFDVVVDVPAELGHATKTAEASTEIKELEPIFLAQEPQLQTTESKPQEEKAEGETLKTVPLLPEKQEDSKTVPPAVSTTATNPVVPQDTPNKVYANPATTRPAAANTPPTPAQGYVSAGSVPTGGYPTTGYPHPAQSYQQTYWNQPASYGYPQQPQAGQQPYYGYPQQPQVGQQPYYGNIPQPQHENYEPYQSTKQGENKEPYQWDYNNYEKFSGVATQKKKNKGLLVFIIILGMCLIAGTIAAIAVNLNANPSKPAISDNAISEEAGTDNEEAGKEIDPVQVKPSPEVDLSLPPTGEPMSIPQIAAKVTPSVVGILRYERNLYEPTGIGSGFIFQIAEGTAYIVTNNHVVENGTNFKIRLDNTEEYDATLVGVDKQTDIAVLSIKATKDMAAADIGDSDKLVVGEPVVAIGNPVSFELSGSVTNGIVSALNRILSDDNSVNYIQTNAAINPGNSGGALVNQYGQVIGINTMKISGEGFEGIGFAIPMATALPIIEEIREHGHVKSRPVLGITGVQVTEAEARKLDCPPGIMVIAVSSSANMSPNMEERDIITHINGNRVLELSDLKGEINNKSIGDSVQITVYRKINTVESEEIEITVRLIESEE